MFEADDSNQEVFGLLLILNPNLEGPFSKFISTSLGKKSISKYQVFQNVMLTLKHSKQRC